MALAALLLLSGLGAEGAGPVSRPTTKPTGMLRLKPDAPEAVKSLAAFANQHRAIFERLDRERAAAAEAEQKAKRFAAIDPKEPSGFKRGAPAMQLSGGAVASVGGYWSFKNESERNESLRESAAKTKDARAKLLATRTAVFLYPTPEMSPYPMPNGAMVTTEFKPPAFGIGWIGRITFIERTEFPDGAVSGPVIGPGNHGVPVLIRGDAVGHPELPVWLKAVEGGVLTGEPFKEEEWTEASPAPSGH